MVLASLIGYFYNEKGPQEYYYQNEIVIVDKKYQCPSHCAIDHYHHVYFEGHNNCMIIDENKLGQKINKKKK